jgi:hypothetical protein
MEQKKVKFKMIHDNFPGVEIYGNGMVYMKEMEYSVKDLRTISNLSSAHSLAYSMFNDDITKYTETFVLLLKQEI